MGKLSFVLLFVALANPIGSHALARAAMDSGLKPLLFRKGELDGSTTQSSTASARSKDKEVGSASKNPRSEDLS